MSLRKNAHGKSRKARRVWCTVAKRGACAKEEVWSAVLFGVKKKKREVPSWDLTLGWSLVTLTRVISIKQ